ncbi:hypothetical protein, partial [Aerococcus sp. HMSC23C02]|uniref:hypothetical protein n=1 Tax=Aerococcus sp. HMSC23C02 TaxID=1581058 RepID=UPI001AEF9EFB
FAPTAKAAPARVASALGAERLRDEVQGCASSVATFFSPSELQRASKAKRRLSLIHIACSFMANDQIQSFTPAQK